MVEQGKKVATIHKSMIIKIQITTKGLKVVII